MSRDPPVLVVEDDADLRDLLSIILESVGVEVETAANGREALARVRAHAPAMILLDMRMPVMDGWQFVRALDERGAPRPPIVVVTAAPDAAARADEVHAEAWLPKPFERAALVGLVDRFVRHASAERREDGSAAPPASARSRTAP